MTQTFTTVRWRRAGRGAAQASSPEPTGCRAALKQRPVSRYRGSRARPRTRRRAAHFITRSGDTDATVACVLGHEGGQLPSRRHAPGRLHLRQHLVRRSHVDIQRAGIGCRMKNTQTGLPAGRLSVCLTYGQDGALSKRSHENCSHPLVVVQRDQGVRQRIRLASLCKGQADRALRLDSGVVRHLASAFEVAAYLAATRICINARVVARAVDKAHRGLVEPTASAGSQRSRKKGQRSCDPSTAAD